MASKVLCFDLEAKGLMNEESIDYSVVPYKLKPSFKMHCGVVKDVHTGEVWKFVGADVGTKMIQLLETADVIVGHNIIGYDLLLLKVMYGIPYSIRDTDEGFDTFNGKDLKIVDTLVLSKCLNPDRRGHSMAWFGDLLGLEKIDWRSEAEALGLCKRSDPKGAEFATYHPAMLVYNERDVDVNIATYHLLMREWGTWDFRPAFVLESQVAELIARQNQRGFLFDNVAAEACVRELDILMEEARALVEPAIPPKKPTKGEADKWCAPKLQLKKADKDGVEKVGAIMMRWIERFEGTYTDATIGSPAVAHVFGKDFTLPMTQESQLESVPAKISDTTHIKEWLMTAGWNPSDWKERDLTVNTKKVKLTDEKYKVAAEKYIAQTLASPFCAARCAKLGLKYTHNKNNLETSLRAKLLEGKRKPGKVFTNPTFTVGVEKETCPDLLRIGETFPHARVLIDFLTYRHRRNSILGGGYDPDDIDDDEEVDPSKGFLAHQRVDGRIPTPADTCGAGTSRFKHKLVANIPRVSSLYGYHMRALFGASAGCYQLGYDFDSLEAKVEAHFCIREGMKRGAAKLKLALTYAESLTANKPFDVHTITAQLISAMVGMAFSRGSAKNVKYGCSYGAQAGRVMSIVGCSMEMAEQIFEAFWDSAQPLADYKETLTKEWTANSKLYIIGIDGRKIPTRSPHALVNSAFQSTGVICAKKAMVIHDRKLRDAGLLVDFFADDWEQENASYCQQMIAYHDEAQLEVSRKDVKFKMFADEQACKDWKAETEEQTGVIWSDVSKSPKGGWFVACTKAGILAVEAVTEAGKHFNLEVELTAGYIIGTNWGNTH